MTAVVAIIVFGLLIFFHELGHFGVAKLVGIKVHEFAIGMGPKFLQFTKGETKYSLRLLPLGGYVRMEGEDEASSDERSFNNKTVVQRIAVLFAGPLMNFILAIFLFFIIFYTIGAPTTTIEQVMVESPAEAVGIQPGDSIVEIDGSHITSWSEIVQEISVSEGRTMQMTLLRNDQEIQKTITPNIEPETQQIMIGIVPEMRASFTASIRNSFDQTFMIIREIVLFLRNIVGREATSTEIMGPVGIISLVGQATRTGWVDVLFLASLISINLGLMNLLPIPALDGSRILFLIVEFLRGKPIAPEKEGMIHLVGFGLLMLLMVFITYQDIVTIFTR
ncbi:RIP metalloprotease RseP [Alkaliphilus metalliredigens]|nr:RIP metalloprotease RseP [Alkaliphilus metalliredigens]